MSKFTGQLGTKATQPGSIELGAGPASNLDQTLTSTITVGQLIGVVVTPHLRWFQSNTITVNQTIGVTRDRAVSVSDTITVTGTPQFYSSADAYLSQYVVEVIYVGNPEARLTSYCIEVLYKRATSETVVDTITVVPSIRKESPVRVTVTSLITVTSTPNVTSGTNVFKTRTDTITVSETVARRSTVVHITVVDSITSGETDAPYDDTRRITRSDTVSVIPSQIGYSNPRRMTVSDLITASFDESIHDTRPHVEVTDRITVSEAYGLYNPNFTFTDHITVNSGISFLNTRVRLAITSNITVVSSPTFRITPNRQLVQSLILLPDRFPTLFAKAFPNPRRMSVVHRIVLTDFNSGTLPSRAVEVQQGIRVLEKIRNNFIKINVNDVVSVAGTFQGAGLTYDHSVSSLVIVADADGGYPTPRRMSVTDFIFVRQRALIHTSLTEISPSDRVLLSSSIDFDIRRKQNVTDTIRVLDTPTLKTSPLRITAQESISVRESIHFSPVHLYLTDTITVTSRPKIDTLIVHDRITVTDKVTRATFIRLLQTLQFSETVTTTRGFNRRIVDPLVFDETLNRNVNWNRSLVNTLLFYDGDKYPKDTSLGVLPISIVVGIIVPNNVKLTGEHGSIFLPPPQFGDREGIVASVVPKRTMSGGTYTFIKTTDRRSLVYTFRVSRLKYFELRAWVIRNLSDTISIIDWKGGSWIGKLTKTPVDFANSPSTIAEWIVVELEFEAVKLSG